MKLVSVLGLLVGGIAAFAADTNVLYLPFSRSSIGAPKSHQEQVEIAKHLPECRPAELDPEGHWGQVTAGLQLGVRLSTNTFSPGQPILMVAILRNTTTNVITVPFANQSSIKPLVLNDGQSVPIWRWHGGSKGRPMLPLPPLSQLTYAYYVSDYFERSGPGVYQVFVVAYNPTFAPDLPEVKSGVAEIKIIGPARK